MIYAKFFFRSGGLAAWRNFNYGDIETARQWVSDKFAFYGHGRAIVHVGDEVLLHTVR